MTVTHRLSAVTVRNLIDHVTVLSVHISVCVIPLPRRTTHLVFACLYRLLISSLWFTAHYCSFLEHHKHHMRKYTIGESRGAPGTRDPPLSPISFIFMQFSAKILSSNAFLVQTQGLAPPPIWEILDLPLYVAPQARSAHTIYVNMILYTLFLNVCG